MYPKQINIILILIQTNKHSSYLPRVACFTPVKVYLVLTCSLFTPNPPPFEIFHTQLCWIMFACQTSTIAFISSLERFGYFNKKIRGRIVLSTKYSDVFLVNFIYLFTPVTIYWRIFSGNLRWNDTINAQNKYINA